MKERFIGRSKPVTEPLEKDNLPTFSTPTKKAVSKDQAKVKLLKEDCSLFGWLYIASQTRDGNLDEFFSYENQPWPPSLSDQGQPRKFFNRALLAQLVEHRTVTQEVASSIPAGPTLRVFK